jgi:hypothetical protein
MCTLYVRMSYAQIPNSRGKSREEAKVDLENSDHGTHADQVIPALLQH